MTSYVESCTILVCMLVWLRSFMISSDYRVYMGSSMIVWSLRWLLLYLCSYKFLWRRNCWLQVKNQLKSSLSSWWWVLSSKPNSCSTLFVLQNCCNCCPLNLFCLLWKKLWTRVLIVSVMVRLDLARIVRVIAPLTATLVWVIYIYISMWCYSKFVWGRTMKIVNGC